MTGTRVALVALAALVALGATPPARGEGGDGEGEPVESFRGPGSALYGTGALIGVVNVITKRGAELDGTQLRLQGGPSAQEASLTWGKPLLGYDVLFNFTFLNAPGQTVQQPASL